MIGVVILFVLGFFALVLGRGIAQLAGIMLGLLAVFIFFNGLAHLESPPAVNKPKPVLIIKRISIDGLPDTDYGIGDSVKCDPAVVISHGQSTHKLDALENRTEMSVPVEWEVDYSSHFDVIVKILDNDGVTSEEVGQCTLSVRSSGKNVTGTLELTDLKHEAPKVVLEYYILD